MPLCNPVFLHHVNGLTLGLISTTHSLVPLHNTGPVMQQYFLIKKYVAVHNISFASVTLPLNSTLSPNVLNLVINMSTHLPVMLIEKLITRISIVNPLFHSAQGQIRPCSHNAFDALFEHAL